MERAITFHVKPFLLGIDLGKEEIALFHVKLQNQILTGKIIPLL